MAYRFKSFQSEKLEEQDRWLSKLVDELLSGDGALLDACTLRADGAPLAILVAGERGLLTVDFDTAVWDSLPLADVQCYSWADVGAVRFYGTDVQVAVEQGRERKGVDHYAWDSDEATHEQALTFYRGLTNLKLSAGLGASSVR